MSRWLKTFSEAYKCARCVWIQVWAQRRVNPNGGRFLVALCEENAHE